MEPDPTGVDPNGRTTAPPLWRAVHRVLGYVFAGIYIVLLTQMLPRLPFVEEETANAATYIHILFGFGVAPVLIFKIFILRRAQKFGKKLPLLGSILLGSAFVIVGLAAPPAVRLRSLLASSAEEVSARNILVERCTPCHGASPIVSGQGDDSWGKVLEEMSEIAQESGKPDPVLGDFALLESYLSRVLPRRNEDGESARGRGRRRGDDERDED
jgi:hypothetical protein